MGQVVRTINDLVLSAFYLIGELDPDESVPSNNLAEGIDLTNQILDGLDGEGISIPYIDMISFTITAAKNQYIVSNVSGIVADITANRITDIEYCNLKFDQVMYPVRYINPTQLYTNYYNNEIQARPSFILLDNYSEYSVLTFYPVPNQSYDIELRAKFFLDKFETFTPIRNIPLFHQRFIKYALARELTSYYPSANWRPEAENEYQNLLRKVMDSNRKDLMCQPSGLLRRSYQGYNGTVYNILGG